HSRGPGRVAGRGDPARHAAEPLSPADQLDRGRAQRSEAHAGPLVSACGRRCARHAVRRRGRCACRRSQHPEGVRGVARSARRGREGFGRRRRVPQGERADDGADAGQRRGVGGLAAGLARDRRRAHRRPDRRPHRGAQGQGLQGVRPYPRRACLDGHRAEGLQGRDHVGGEAMKERLYLFDTTLRDGAQTNGVDFTLADKLAIARMLDELGVDYVEGGYPGANPTDTELFGEDRKLNTATFTAFAMTRRPGRSASNDPGLVALLDARADAICFVAKSWDYHVRVALETTLEENLASICDSVTAAKAKGREVLLDCEHFFDGYKA